jgi:Holliday junction resolvasome RuvABC endonuclease subunit
MGLDLGTHTGWARTDIAAGKGGVFMSGTWDFSPTRFDSPSTRYTKFGIELRNHLTLGVDLIFYEKVHRHMGTAAAHAYGAFLNKLHETADEFGVPYQGLSVQEIKKHATGKGNAKKAAMIEAARLWGYRPGSEDEADAICILKCGLETKL